MNDIFESNLDNEDVLNFVQNNGDFYLSKFNKMKESKKPFSWNWPAFLFSGAWMLYRKMYSIGIGVIIVSELCSNIFHSTILNWLIAILFGLFGNYIYLNHCNSKISIINCLDSSQKQKELSKQGGVTFTAIIVVFIVLFIFNFILSYFSL